MEGQLLVIEKDMEESETEIGWEGWGRRERRREGEREGKWRERTREKQREVQTGEKPETNTGNRPEKQDSRFLFDSTFIPPPKWLIFLRCSLPERLCFPEHSECFSFLFQLLTAPTHKQNCSNCWGRGLFSGCTVLYPTSFCSSSIVASLQGLPAAVKRFPSFLRKVPSYPGTSLRELRAKTHLPNWSRMRLIRQRDALRVMEAKLQSRSGFFLVPSAFELIKSEWLTKCTQKGIGIQGRSFFFSIFGKTCFTDFNYNCIVTRIVRIEDESCQVLVYFSSSQTPESLGTVNQRHVPLWSNPRILDKFQKPTIPTQIQGSMQCRKGNSKTWNTKKRKTKDIHTGKLQANGQDKNLFWILRIMWVELYSQLLAQFVASTRWFNVNKPWSVSQPTGILEFLWHLDAEKDHTQFHKELSSKEMEWSQRKWVGLKDLECHVISWSLIWQIRLICLTSWTQGVINRMKQF